MKIVASKTTPPGTYVIDVEQGIIRPGETKLEAKSLITDQLTLNITALDVRFESELPSTFNFASGKT